MVLGSGQLGQFWRRELENQFRRFHDRLTFVWSDDLSVPEILRRCASLPARLGDLLCDVRHGRAGAAYADERVLADLHAAANAPLFARAERVLRPGIVGGSMMSIDELGRRTADVAVRLLNGAAPSSVNVPPQLPGPADFRLARVTAMEHPREPVAAGQRRALSRSEPVAAHTRARC